MKLIACQVLVRLTINLHNWRQNAIRKLGSISDESEIEVNAILKHQLSKSSAWILLNPDCELSPEQIDKLESNLFDLQQKKPLAYVLGFQEFYGINFFVNPSVLIPRPETELLVEQAIKWGKKLNKPLSILDVGIGSGCIALSILKTLPNSYGFGVDISYAALKIAKINAKQLDLSNKIVFLNSNLTTPLIGRFDLICANLPYIPTNDLQILPHAKFEPMLALDGGLDGLAYIRVLLYQLKEKINIPGMILLEIQNDQSDKVTEYAKTIFPNSEITTINDYSFNPRIIKIVISQ